MRYDVDRERVGTQQVDLAPDNVFASVLASFCETDACMCMSRGSVSMCHVVALSAFSSTGSLSSKLQVITRLRQPFQVFKKTKNSKLEKVAVVQFIKGENKTIFDCANLVKI